MKYFPKNTLAYFNAAPQFHPFDTSKWPVPTVGTATKKFQDTEATPKGSTTMPQPETEALDFYLLNHFASMVRNRFTVNEPLPAWAQRVMEEYLSVVTLQGQRMFHYLMLIITRESRHLQGMKSIKPFTSSEDHWKHVAKEFGQEFHDFLKNKKGGEDSVSTVYKNGGVKMPLGLYVAGIEYCFVKGVYPSSYGGKPWANISKCALDFVLGKTTMEMMVDTAYTLAHNNGPIFNKGMLYMGYGSAFKKLLDIQRGGQIPQLVLEDKNYHDLQIYFTERHKEIAKLVSEANPGEFEKFIDWYAVEAMGSIGKYPVYKQKQKQLYPQSVEKWEAPPEVLIHGEKARIVGEFDVFPEQTVKVYKRVKAGEEQ